MRRNYLCTALVGGLLVLSASCSHEQETAAEPHEAQGLYFTVSSGQNRAVSGGSAEQTEEEGIIRSLYIYAFDDSYAFPDYYAEPSVNGGKGQAGEYTVSMDIYDKGTKRFYLVANPPEYIREQLTPSCSEERLKHLVLNMQHPIHKMAELPQNIDGLTGQEDRGFPMCNIVTAAAVLKNQTSRQMELKVPETAAAGSGLKIKSIPLLRALGKVIVKAYLKDNNDSPVSITGISVYNYAGNGLFFPAWSGGQSDWVADGSDGGTAVWNKGRELDLRSHADWETRLLTTAIPVFDGGGEPGNGLVDGTGSDNAREITAFYLCQNSYGEKEKDNQNSQEGLPDVVGNRTTRMVVSLSDGRSKEVELPYLRRNDRLTVRLGISRFSVHFEFQRWQLATVTPDWSEDNIQPPTEKTTSYEYEP